MGVKLLVLNSVARAVTVGDRGCAEALLDSSELARERLTVDRGVPRIRDLQGFLEAIQSERA